jgi:glutamate N-acetyltransferase/amino-acid N-acetyltransferase
MNQANVAAAAYQWVLKDGIGTLGAILFASKFGKNFDADIKKFRFLSILALNISLWIEITTLVFPQHFLIIASLANMGKNICFMLSSASKASINLRFAKQNNLADIQGKAVS